MATRSFLATACAALGVSRAALYRARRPTPARTPSIARRPSPRRLTEEERQRILDTLHDPRFVDQPPAEVYATLLGEGAYIGSIRTMYRVLADSGEVRERRNVRAAQVHPTPSLTATAPNQVRTWDITKLATTEKGKFFHLYVILDLFSRFVVGWLLAAKECKHLAATMLGEAIARHGVEPGLIVHVDRGSAMKSDTVAQLLSDLGASRSFSRPRVSDDNAFSEAQFKTLKYQPDYPVRFASEVHARGWLEPFFGWHNDEHHHAGLALFTPADVFHGRVDQVAEDRQRALDAAYAAHPERFPNGPPTVRRPPTKVEINLRRTDRGDGGGSRARHRARERTYPHRRATLDRRCGTARRARHSSRPTSVPRGAGATSAGRRPIELTYSLSQTR
ncbi:MAG: IS3 family transposase [Polyangiaceae bacterium]